jgi:hypothetical protein
VVSIGGGDEPVWAASGTELFYRTSTDLRVVSVASAGPELRVGRPTTLFPDPFVRDMGAGAAVANYDVSPSGDWFVMVTEQRPGGSSEVEQPGLHLVLNFFEELRARVPN